ncbi:Acetyl esterase/lipase [Alkalibacterium putridalgicola]|uniref:Lipase n=1 Tax=Alkalibacterium putridalgicola TaxID=426703 RepID=A0A1H7VW54_9LACT|nr:alpha/beta hydrolase [Alkalibacterium putridalgicola]GEK89388.1 lipase [Alkalibacterium putridalgicola]SEM13513.1 Acetyl esterase/lipase [Alkalibacterium putridalgicola]
MSLASLSFRIAATIHDTKRDWGLKADPTIRAHSDIQYGKSKKYNSLDVYYPKGTNEKLPVIVNFHGGGYVHGLKKNYLHYGMFLAKQGFVFVNPSYHLAPKKKYPTPLEELNQVMHWMVANHEQYYIDTSNVFIIGDSAGAQLAFQYSTMYTNPEYSKLFDFALSQTLDIQGSALNCGMYEIYKKMASLDEEGKNADLELVILLKDYLGKNWQQYEEQFTIKDFVTDKFPPTYLMTAQYDLLRDEALPMYEALIKRGVKVTYKKFGDPGEEQYGHIFQCNMNLEEAKEANKEQCHFFKSLVK